MTRNRVFIFFLISTFALGCETPELPGIDSELESSSAKNSTNQSQDESSSEFVPDRAKIKADAKTSMTGLYEGDVQGLIRTLHPKIVEIAGGEEDFRKMITTFVDVTQKSNPVVEKFEIVGEPRFVGSGNRFVIVAIHMVVDADAHIETTSFIVGERQPDDNYRFIDGEKISANPEFLDKILPSFPKNQSFPKHEIREIQ